MELWQVYAYMKGYKRRQLNVSSQSVYTGFWAAYYVGAKRPKSPKRILERMQHQVDTLCGDAQPMQAPDVETYMRRENHRIQQLRVQQQERQPKE